MPLPHIIHVLIYVMCYLCTHSYHIIGHMSFVYKFVHEWHVYIIGHVITHATSLHMYHPSTKIKWWWVTLTYIYITSLPRIIHAHIHTTLLATCHPCTDFYAWMICVHHWPRIIHMHEWHISNVCTYHPHINFYIWMNDMYILLVRSCVIHA